MNKRWIISFLFLSLCLSFLLYANIIPGGFVHDDYLFTFRAELRQFPAALGTFFQPYLPTHIQAGVWRPLSTYAIAAEFLMFGQSTAFFHIVNILFNGINTWLVFLLCYLLFRKKSLALLTGLLFAFLPIHSEAVASIKSVEDLLGAFFFLLSWIIFLLGTTRSPKFWIFLCFSALCALLSVLSKETYILGPMIFLTVFLISHHVTLKRWVTTSLFFLPGIVLYLMGRYFVLRAFAFGADDEPFVINPLRFVPLSTRIWTGFQMLFLYIKTILFPIRLSASYHFNQIPLISRPWDSWQTVIGILIVLLSLFLLSQKVIRKNPIGIGILIFFIPYLLVSKFIVTGGELMAERWMYIPSFGIVLILGYGLDYLIKFRKPFGIILFCATVGLFGLRIISRNTVWLSDKNFTSAMVQDSPQSVQAHFAMGDLYLSEGNVAKAKQEATLASAIYTDYAPLLTLQGSLAGIDHQYPLAEKYLRKALTVDPTYFLAGAKLALVLVAQERYQDALSLYSQLIPQSYGRLKINDYFFYAVSLTKTKKYQQSIEVLTQNVGVNQSPDARFLLAANYYKLGDLSKAKEYFDWDATKAEAEKIQIIESY